MVSPGFAELASFLGISMQTFIILSLILIWDSVWKIAGMWKAASRKNLAWFIVLAIFNTVGILPILYIFLFSKLSLEEKPEKTKKLRKR